MELAAQALISLIDTTELFPFVIKVDLYGGIFSVYASECPQRKYADAPARTH
jgi:hypothetical protein